MVTSAEMRAQARYYTDIAATESALPLKALVARHALALSQLAERIERAERAAVAAQMGVIVAPSGIETQTGRRAN